MKEHKQSRRAFVKKASYAAPAVLSLQAFSSVAKAGSNKDERTPKPPKHKRPPTPRKPRKPRKGPR